jgi:DNA-binding response OmpR family regulator
LSAPTAILLVESDRAAGEGLAAQLAADGYRVELARTVAHARSLSAAGRPQAAILGRLEIPRGAIALIEEIRAAAGQPSCWSPALPALVLGARAGEPAAVRAFEAGADDFMPASVGYLELRARLRAVLRRALPSRPDDAPLRVGALTVDPLRRVASVDGRRLDLRRMEYELLLELAREPARIHAREELLRTVWGYRCPGSTRTVDAHACRLRRKLGPGGPWIVGVRGLGYRLT